MQDYIVAAVGDWNLEMFELCKNDISGNWHYVSTPEDLRQLLNTVNPEFIFFPHWRWIVPNDIIETHECVCFHMTDLPFGRGGSPLQNLLIRGFKATKLTALRMIEDLDAGPIYMKRPLDLNGKASEIYRRAAELTWQMISELIVTKPKPIPQSGNPVYFKRRSPAQSEIPVGLELEQLYDFIRMLDAPGYPKAFIRHDGMKYEFEDVKLESGKLQSSVAISKSEAQ